MSSFKVKIGVISFIIVAIMTVAMMMLTVSPLSKQGKAQAISAVRRGAKLVERSQRLYAFDIVSRAKTIAESAEIRTALKLEEEKKRRAALYVEIQEQIKKLGASNVSFLGIVDKQAAVVVRDRNPDANLGDKLKYNTVSRTLKDGYARSGVWSMNNSMMRAAVAPILDAGNIVGAVVLAYGFTKHEAQTDQKQFGAHVAYILGKKMRATSFVQEGSTDTEDAQKSAALSSAIMAKAQEAMKAGKVSDVIEVKVAGETFKAITGPLPAPIRVVTHGAQVAKVAAEKNDQAVGFVVVSSLDKAMAPAVKARLLVLAFGVIVLLLVLGCMMAVARHFVNAQDQLELGINEVINGDMEYIFDAQQEFEGMANALNVMLARLLGRPEPGEEEDGDAAWRADVIVVDPLEGASDPAVAQQLAAEAEDHYFSRLYNEYVEKRRAANLPTEGLDLEGLTQKLRANEAMLKAKHKCRMVRFVVVAAAGKVTFKPVRID